MDLIRVEYTSHHIGGEEDILPACSNNDNDNDNECIDKIDKG